MAVIGCKWYDPQEASIVESWSTEACEFLFVIFVIDEYEASNMGY